MSSDSRADSSDPPGLDGEDASGDVRWHQSRAGDQVVLGVKADGVRVAVAFSVDASRTDVRAALDERDRELGHYFETRPNGPTP